MKKTNWTKKATLVLAAICLALSVANGVFTKPQAAWLLQVDGVPVYRELYAYYLSEALREPAYRGAETNAEKRKALRKDVALRCTAFIAVNSELHNMWQVLEQQYKSQVSERTGFLWRVFGGYYRSIGVGKQTLYLVETYKANQKQLFYSLYDGGVPNGDDVFGGGGPRQVPEQMIKDYFYRTHAAYEGLRIFRTLPDEAGGAGAERPMTTQESAALKARLEAIAAEVNGGQDFFATCEKYAQELSYTVPSTAEFRRGDPGFNAAEFEKVRQLDPAKLTVLEFGGFFLLARGVNMGDSPEEYYLPQRSACLWEMRQAEYASLLKQLTATYRADENEAAVDALLEDWQWDA